MINLFFNNLFMIPYIINWVLRNTFFILNLVLSCNNNKEKPIYEKFINDNITHFYYILYFLVQIWCRPQWLRLVFEGII